MFGFDRRSKENAYFNWIVGVFGQIKTTLEKNGIPFSIYTGVNESAIDGYSAKLDSGVKLHIYYLMGIKVDFILEDSKAGKQICEHIARIVDPDRYKVEMRAKNGTPCAWSMRLTYFKEHIESMGGKENFSEMIYRQLVNADKLLKASKDLIKRLENTYSLANNTREEVLNSVTRTAEKLGIKPAE